MLRKLSKKSLLESKIATIAAVVVYSSWTLLSLVGLSRGAVLLVISFLAATMDLSSFSEPGVGVTLAVMGLQYAIALTIALLPYLLQPTVSWRSIKVILGVESRPKAKDLWLVPVVYAVYLVLALAIDALVAVLVPSYDPGQTQQLGFDGFGSWAELTMGFVGLVVLAPIFEELLFRGYLFYNLRRRLRFVYAAVICGVVFGVTHGQWNVGLDTALLGMFACWLREKTGSIWMSILLHGLKNAVAFALLFGLAFLFA